MSKVSSLTDERLSPRASVSPVIEEPQTEARLKQLEMEFLFLEHLLDALVALANTSQARELGREFLLLGKELTEQRHMWMHGIFDSFTRFLNVTHKILRDNRLTKLSTTRFGMIYQKEFQGDDEADNLIDQVYTVALNASACTAHLRLMAEVLHKKWLSEPGFAPVAAKIAFRLRDIKSDAVPLWSIVYGLVWNDYKDREGVRKVSRGIFTNAAQFTFEFFHLFYTDDVDNVFRTLIMPMFDYAKELVDDQSTEQEIRMFYTIVVKLGFQLEHINPVKMAEILLATRKRLIEATITPHSRCNLLEVLELHERGWEDENMSVPVKRLYRGFKETRRISVLSPSHDYQKRHSIIAADAARTNCREDLDVVPSKDRGLASHSDNVPTSSTMVSVNNSATLK